MSFTTPRHKIPARAAAMLVREPPRDAGGEPAGPAPYDLVAPGLYPDETVVKLDSGETVAVSVQRRPLPQLGMMEFRGWARVIEDDGRTRLDAFGQEIENEYAHVAAVGSIQSAGGVANSLSGEDQLSREVLLAMLGERPTVVDILVIEGAVAPADLPEGATADPAQDRAPLLDIADDVRASVSIRSALRLASLPPEGNVAALLDKALTQEEKKK